MIGIICKQIITGGGTLTKEKLKQYRSLKKEIVELTEQIASYKTHATVKSSSEFPYSQHVVTVRGSQPSYRKYRLHERKVECRKLSEEIEDFVNSIEDSLTRRIFTYRYISGSRPMGWQRIACEIGGGNTADSVRMHHNRYMKSK